MKKFVDKYPINARIFINHKTKEVRFEYPSNGQKNFSFIGYTYPSFLIYWIIVNGIILILYSLFILSFLYKKDLLVVEKTDFISVLIILSSIIYIFIIPLLYSWFISYNYHKIQNTFPDFNAKISTIFGKLKKRVKIKKLNKPEFELPLFKNVMMNYHATKDFSRYLNNVKIVEHEFNELRERKGRPEKNNDELWKAVFYFDKIPKRGELNIDYY